MENKDDEKKVKIEIKIDPDKESGSYSNMSFINFTQEEFVLDFGVLNLPTKKCKIQSRTFMTPKNVKRLTNLLSNSLKKYEEKFGSLDQSSDSGFTLNLN